MEISVKTFLSLLGQSNLTPLMESELELEPKLVVGAEAQAKLSSAM